MPEVTARTSCVWGFYRKHITVSSYEWSWGLKSSAIRLFVRQVVSRLNQTRDRKTSQFRTIGHLWGHPHVIADFNPIVRIVLTDFILESLQWRHIGRDSVSNHQPHDCSLNHLFGRRSKKTSKLRVTGLCKGNSPGTGEFPAPMASYAKNVSIWWRHHDLRHLKIIWFLSSPTVLRITITQRDARTACVCMNVRQVYIHIIYMLLFSLAFMRYAIILLCQKWRNNI